MEVVAPVQEGANRALKPVRDLFGWFGDTVDAKDERDKLEAERDQLRQQVAGSRWPSTRTAQLRGLVDYDAGAASRTTPRSPRACISRSPTSWYSTIEINKGSSDGVRANQPVINAGPRRQGQGRLGRQRGRDAAHRHRLRRLRARHAQAASRASVPPVAGSPGDLLFDLVPDAKQVRKGDSIVTAGTVSDAAAVAVPAGDPDRHGPQGQRQRRARPDDPRHAGRRPAQPRLRPGADAAERRPARVDHRDAVTGAPPPSSASSPLGLVGGILQLTTVSQIAIFGVPADLTPLLVASVGLLCGSIPGRVLRLRRSACSWTRARSRRSA